MKEKNPCRPTCVNNYPFIIQIIVSYTQILCITSHLINVLCSLLCHIDCKNTKKNGNFARFGGKYLLLYHESEILLNIYGNAMGFICVKPLIRQLYKNERLELKRLI